MTLAYRVASRKRIRRDKKISKSLTEVISFRSMVSQLIRKQHYQALVQVKSVDKNYLAGKIKINPELSIEDALKER